MRTHDAISIISQSIIDTGLCEAILLKGSFGRGDDDAFSDIDMYVVTSPEHYDAFLSKRYDCLLSYRDIVFSEENQFASLQMLAIYDNGLHIDLYTTTQEKMNHSDPIKVCYDPNHLFSDYSYVHEPISQKELVSHFHNVLYGFIEADSAFRRKNYPWTARILDHSLASATILLRSLVDPEYAFLGLKKANEILPSDQYDLLVDAYANLHEGGFWHTNDILMHSLELFLKGTPDTSGLNLKFYTWMQENINQTLFPKSTVTSAH